MINPRQERILAAVVQEYVANAQPVASKCLAEKTDFNVSPATIRNDMVTLEEAGLLRQPHTSSGRIPTEEGYRYFLERFVRKKRVPKVQVRLSITQAQPADTFKDYLRGMSKSLVKVSGETAFISQEDGWHYYTGVANLFDKPEFNDVVRMKELSHLVDEFDEVVRRIAPGMNNDVNVWIGGQNPFGSEMATVMVKYTTKNQKSGVIGLVGPQRMNYARNMKLLNEARDAIQSKL